MPIYEYECVDKKHRFEAMQKIADRPLKKCTVCGGKVRKLVSNAAFSLKGGGWYKDGYASTNGASGKSEAKTEKKAETKSESSKPTKGESK
jgi:putative FmdB family regulatory protein